MGHIMEDEQEQYRYNNGMFMSTYYRLNNAFVRGHQCLYPFPNAESDNVFVDQSPLEAKNGDVFCAPVMMENGYTYGAIWAPEELMHYFQGAIPVATFANFEEAREDALETMAVAALTVSAKDLGSMVFKEQKLQNSMYRRMINTAEKKGALRKLIKSTRDFLWQNKETVMDTLIFPDKQKKIPKP